MPLAPFAAFDLDRVKAWASATLAWAKRTWPDQLASFVIHSDEQNIHAHLMVVPRVRATDGTWKLNSKGLFDRERLRELQTSYGEALAPLGIRRGEPGSKAEHTEVAQFYGAVQAVKAMPQRVPVPPAPKKPQAPETLGGKVVEGLASLIGFETAHQRELSQYSKAARAWRERARAAKEQDAKAWKSMQSVAAMKPLARQKPTRGEAVSPPPPALPRAAPPRPKV